MELSEIIYQCNTIGGFDEKMAVVRNAAKTIGRDGVIKLAPLIGYAPSKLLQYADIDNFLEDRKRGRHNRKPRPRLPFIIKDRELPQDAIRRLNTKTTHWEGQENEDYCEGS